MCRMRVTLSNCDSWAQRIDQITIMLSRLWICNAIMQSCQASLDTIIIIIWPKIHTYLYWCSSAMVCVIFSGIITNDMIINISLMFLSSSSRSYSQWCGSPMASVRSSPKGSLFFPKISFFLKFKIRDLSFSKNVNVVFIGKSEFFV